MNKKERGRLAPSFFISLKLVKDNLGKIDSRVAENFTAARKKSQALICDPQSLHK